MDYQEESKFIYTITILKSTFLRRKNKTSNRRCKQKLLSVVTSLQQQQHLEKKKELRGRQLLTIKKRICKRTKRKKYPPFVNEDKGLRGANTYVRMYRPPSRSKSSSTQSFESIVGECRINVMQLTTENRIFLVWVPRHTNTNKWWNE